MWLSNPDNRGGKRTWADEVKAFARESGSSVNEVPPQSLQEAYLTPEQRVYLAQDVKEDPGVSRVYWGFILEAKRRRPVEEQAARARHEDLIRRAKVYFDETKIRLTGGVLSHEQWPVRMPVKYDRMSGTFDRDNRPALLPMRDEDGREYVTSNHVLIVAVDRFPGARHSRRSVEVRNALLARAYRKGSWSTTPATLTRAQGWIEGWEDTEAFVFGQGDPKERARASLFDTWRTNRTFLSTSSSDYPLSFKAMVYLVYQVEAYCPLLDLGQEVVIPPGVEMRARRVEVQESVLPGGRGTVFFYVIEAEVRKSATYKPEPLPLPEE